MTISKYSRVSEQFDLFPAADAQTDNSAVLYKAARERLILHARTKQNSAHEVLSSLELELGWRVRTHFTVLVRELRDATDIEGYLREYFRTTLNEENWASR